jgi:hypothetical protein
MLFRNSLNEALTEKNAEFENFLREYSTGVETYLAALDRLTAVSHGEIEQQLGSAENAGAIPAAEIEGNRSMTFPFSISWENHEQARKWAAVILDDRTTFAADGSQVYVAKETSLPVAAVQIGWFENPHNFSAEYEKNARFEILTPQDLLKELEEPMNPDIRVEARRYIGEVERVCEFLRKKQGWRERGERMPVAFFDNPLLVPFSQRGLQRSFLDATVQMVRLSAETRVPVVGYVDRSFSRDILTMLDKFGGHGAHETSLYDASLLRVRRADGLRVLNSWGDRTCFCYSRRRGLEAFSDASTGRSIVGFVYMQTSTDAAAARLDVPSWVYKEALLDEVIDVVRAECVVGLGYPYALEAADATAVISVRDREVFFRALQEFASRGKLDFSVSRKDTSKNRRR